MGLNVLSFLAALRMVEMSRLNSVPTGTFVDSGESGFGNYS